MSVNGCCQRRQCIQAAKGGVDMGKTLLWRRRESRLKAPVHPCQARKSPDDKSLHDAALGGRSQIGRWPHRHGAGRPAGHPTSGSRIIESGIPEGIGYPTPRSHERRYCSRKRRGGAHGVSPPLWRETGVPAPLGKWGLQSCLADDVLDDCGRLAKGSQFRLVVVGHQRVAHAAGAGRIPLPGWPALVPRSGAAEPQGPRLLGTHATAHRAMAASGSYMSSLSPASHERHHLRQEPSAVVPLAAICGGGHGQP